MPSIRWDDHSDHVMCQVTKFYKNLEFTDCMLDTEGGLIPAHKTILAACSPYLKKLFMDHHGMKIIPFKDIKYNDMKLILDFLYYGKVDVPVSNVDSLVETADLLEITSVMYVSLKYLDKFPMKDNSERSLGDSGSKCCVNPMKHDESNLSTKENRIMCNTDFLHVSEDRLNCENIDLRSRIDFIRRASSVSKRPSEKVNEDQAQFKIPNFSVMEQDAISKNPADLQDELIPITFVAVSPVAVRTEEFDEQERAVCVSNSQLKNPLEDYPYNNDMTEVMNIERERNFQFQSQGKREIKREINICELGSKSGGLNTPITKAMENNLCSDAPFTCDVKNSCAELTATMNDNMLKATEHLGGVQSNQNETFDSTISSFCSEGCFVKRAHDVVVKMESVCDDPESNLTEEKLFVAGLDIVNFEDNDNEQNLMNEGGEILKCGTETIIDCKQDMSKEFGVASTSVLKVEESLERIDAPYVETGNDYTGPSRQNRNEILQKKREAAKRRRDNIKNDPLLWKMEQEKQRIQYDRKKQKKKVKLVADMTPAELRAQREEWRTRSKKAYCKKNAGSKNSEEVNLTSLTDPSLSSFMYGDNADEKRQ